MPKIKPVGVVGLGRMGGPLAIRLGSKRSDIYIWDIDPDIRNEISKKKNLTVAEPNDMSQKCSMIFFVCYGTIDAPQPDDITISQKRQFRTHRETMVINPTWSFQTISLLRSGNS